MLHVAWFMHRGHDEIHKKLSWQHHHLLSFRRILQSGLPPFLLSAITYTRSHTLTQAYTHQLGYEPHACPALGPLSMRTRKWPLSLRCTMSQPVGRGRKTFAMAPCRIEALRCIRSRPRSACAAAAVALLMADGGLPMRRALAKVVKARPATDLRQGSQVGGELDRAVRRVGGKWDRAVRRVGCKWDRAVRPDCHPRLASITP